MPKYVVLKKKKMSSNWTNVFTYFTNNTLNIIFTDSNANENTTEAVCSLSRAPESEQCTGTDSDASTFVEYYAMFILGQIFHGIGAVPMFTIALTYIDENCKQKMTSLYVCEYS